MIIEKIRLNNQLQLSTNGTISIKPLDYTPEFVKYKIIKGKDIKENDELFITSKQLFFPVGLPDFSLEAEGVTIRITAKEYNSIDELVAEINRFSFSLFNTNIAFKLNDFSFSLKPAISYILIPDDSYLINIFDQHFVINKIPSYLIEKEFILYEFGIPKIEENLLYNYISEFDREWIKSDPGFSIFFDALAIEFERIYKLTIDISDTLDKEKIKNISKALGLSLDKIDVLNEINVVSLFKQLIQFISKKGTYFSLYRMLNSLGFVVEKIEELDVNDVPFTKNLIDGIVIDFYKQYLENSELRKGFVWYGDEYLDPVLAKHIPGRIIKSGDNYYKSDGKQWILISKSDEFIENEELEKKFFMISNIDDRKKISVKEFNALVDNFSISINNIQNIGNFPIDSENIRFNSFVKLHNIEPLLFSNDTEFIIEIDSIKYEIDFAPLLRSVQRNYLFMKEIFLYLLEHNVPCALDQFNNIIFYSNIFNRGNTIKIIQKPLSFSMGNIYIPQNNASFIVIDSSDFYSLSNFQPDSVVKFYKNGLVTSNKPFPNGTLFNGIYVSRLPRDNEQLVSDVEILNNGIFKILKVYDKKSNYRYPKISELDQDQYLYILAFYRNKRNSAYHEEPTSQNSFYSRSGDKLTDSEAGLSSEVTVTIHKTPLIKTIDQNFVNQLFYAIEFVRSVLISLLSFVIVLERFYDKLEKITEKFNYGIPFSENVNKKNLLWRRSLDPKFNIPNIAYDNYDINQFLINFIKIKRKDLNITPIFDRHLEGRELSFIIGKDDYDLDINLIKNIFHIPSAPPNGYQTSEKLIMHIENDAIIKSIYENGFSHFLNEFHEYSSSIDYNQKTLLYDDLNPNYYDMFSLSSLPPYREITFDGNSKKSIKHYYNDYTGFFRKHMLTKDSEELIIKTIPDINNGEENYFLISDYPLTENPYLSLNQINNTIIPEGSGTFNVENLANNVPYPIVNDVIFLNNNYIISVYNLYTGQGAILLSNNLSSWSNTTISPNNPGYGFIPMHFEKSINDTIICVARGYTTGMILRSTNGGMNWNIVQNNIAQMEDIAYGNNTFISIGWDSTTIYAYKSSDDGSTWNTAFSFNPISSSVLMTCEFGNGKFVIAVADDTYNTHIFTSSDNGTTWTETFNSSSLGFQLIPISSTYTGNQFIITCNKRRILKSTDGINWTIEEIPLINLFSSPPNPILKDAYAGVAYGNGFINIISAMNNPNNYNRLIFSNNGGSSWNNIDLVSIGSIITRGKMRFINNYFFVQGTIYGTPNTFFRFNITDAPSSVYRFISP